MKYIKSFNESIIDEIKIIEEIKKSLIMETLIDEEEFQEEYNGDWNKAWEDYVDKQNIGDCQGIVSSIIHYFPQVVKCFGEIEVDNSYIDENNEEQILMTHHWIKINDTIYDFSKGTLMDYIQWDDVYNVSTIGDEWRYN
jgi:hypothetical protein